MRFRWRGCEDACVVGIMTKRRVKHMASRAKLNLKEFMTRMQVLGLYRDIHRSLKHIQSPSERAFIRDWTRFDFKKSATVTDPEMIQFLLSKGKAEYHHLQSNLQLSARAPADATTVRPKKIAGTSVKI
ncbi:hypothetical protein BC830DRAFT_195642 [Chytriomyces sp. MP71]|nr:hypothetical protein BC830DRAFT_195642 [Chytriomyces sp. MP71]